MRKQYKKKPNFEILNFKLLTHCLKEDHFHIHFMKGQKWDLSISIYGSRVQVSLLWSAVDSPLIRWTQKGARSGLSFPDLFSGLLRADEIDFSKLWLELLTMTHLSNAYFRQSIGDSPIIDTFLALYLVLGKLKWAQQNFPLTENLQSSSKRQKIRK